MTTMSREDQSQETDPRSLRWAAPTRTDSVGVPRSYVRFAALGDSVTFGLGDPLTGGGVRGWARLLADAIGRDHDVSFYNIARPGATAADVRATQLASAVAHRPQLASLIVGLNDTMRSTWDPRRVRQDLLYCAAALAERGTCLLTVRYHDHTRVFRLPRLLADPMRQRIDVLNAVYDEIYSRHGGLRVDLAAHPGIYDHQFWSVDRLHPAELGHRALAEEFSVLLNASGLAFDPPELALDGRRATRARNLVQLVTEATPWLARRALDLAPWTTRRWLIPRVALAAQSA